MDRYITIKGNRITTIRYGAEIVDGEILDDGTYGDIGQILLNDVWQKDPQEIADQIKRSRISELKELISNMIGLGDDVTAERAELRTLLGL